MSTFLDDDYEVPVSGGGFTKLQDGDNRLRILSEPKLMWSEWRDGKKINHEYDPKKKPAKGDGQKDSVKHCWGLIVFNYGTKAVECFELDKQDIISNLTKYAKDPDWGHPKEYDIVITKTGSGLDTEYSLVCKPKSEAGQDIVDAFLAKPMDLDLLIGENTSPFIKGEGDAESTKATSNATKKVTSENWTKGDEIPEGYQEKDGKLKKKKPF